MSIVPTITASNNIYLLEEAQESNCVMLIGKNYISYAVTDAAFQTVYQVHHYNSGTKPVNKNDFQQILSLPEIKKAKKVHIALDSYKSTLVPYSLYKEEFKMPMFEFVEYCNHDEEVLSYNITDSVIDLFAVKKSTLQFLSSMLPNYEIHSASACLLRNYPDHLVASKTHNIFIAVKDDMAIITHYINGMLQLHQLVPYCFDMDIVYHVCNIVNVKEITPDDCSIILHGECNMTENVSEQLKKYFHFVKYITRLKNLHYPDGLYTYPSHYFFNLFSLFACAL